MESCPPAISSDTVDAGGYALMGTRGEPPQSVARGWSLDTAELSFLGDASLRTQELRVLIPGKVLPPKRVKKKSQKEY